MRYRYIFNGEVKASDKISNYRLLDKQKMQGENDVIRVEIPEDAKLEKWACDEYAICQNTTNLVIFCIKNPPSH